MPFYKSVFILALVLMLNSCANEQKVEFYELKTYTLVSDNQETLMDEYLSTAYLPALKKLGLKDIGVFKSRSEEGDSTLRIYVLIAMNDLNKLSAIEDIIMIDTEFQQSAKAFLNAPNDAAPYQRQSTTIMKAFSDMPLMKPSPLTGPRKERIYELRSYESATEAKYRNKVDMFNAGGEVKLFETIGSNAVFYGEVISGPAMPNLVYMTTYENEQSQKDHWKAFVDSPEWQKMKTLPEYQDNVSHIDIDLLYPTEYSDY